MKVFVVGKGGTGKSTVSVALSLILKEKGVKVISLDPAHNIKDILSYGTAQGIEVVEPDFDEELKKYLKKLTDTMKKEAFRYLTLFNLENLVDTLRYSPGTEEHMLLEAIERHLSDSENVVFDTPPTGLFLKVLGLLENNILWISRLIKLREDIVKRKNLKDDRILELLNVEFAKLNSLKENLLKNAVFINVMNEDALSLRESKRIITFLRKRGYRVILNVVNKSSTTQTFFENIKHINIPPISGNPYEIASGTSRLLEEVVKEVNDESID